MFLLIAPSGIPIQGISAPGGWRNHLIEKNRVVIPESIEEKMERYDKFVSLFWLSLGLTILFGSYKIGLGRLSHPGGGLFVFVLGMCLSLLALVIFISVCRKKEKVTESVSRLWVGLKWRNPIYLLISLIIYTLIITKLGYVFSTILLLVFLFNVIERQKWKVVLFEAISFTFLSYLVFGVWLQIRFPRGIFELLVGL